jgi:hypothetical protein
MSGNGVSDGQIANQTTFNGGFISRNSDSDTVAKLDLLNNGSDPLSGTDIVNLQKNINALASALGIPVNQIAAYLVSWASNVVGLSSSSAVAKIEALVLKFRDTVGNGGHGHTGIDGDAPQVSALDLSDFNPLRAEFQFISYTGASGSSVDITTQMLGKSPNGDSVTEGVITSGAYNQVYIVDSSTGTFLEDVGGQRIYGRITYSAGVWTLSFYTNEAGVETSASISSTNIDIFYREVFSVASLPTIPSDPGQFGTLDVTADVVDASTTQRGVVSTGTQGFAGNKTFTGTVESANNKPRRNRVTLDANETEVVVTMTDIGTLNYNVMVGFENLLDDQFPFLQYVVREKTQTSFKVILNAPPGVNNHIMRWEANVEI